MAKINETNYPRRQASEYAPTDMFIVQPVPDPEQEHSGDSRTTRVSDLKDYILGDADPSKIGTPAAGTYTSASNTNAQNIEALDSALANYDHLTKQVATQSEINGYISDPTTASFNVIYLLKDASATGSDKYFEYQRLGTAESSTFEMTGDTSTDLSNYFTKAEINAALAEKMDVVKNKGSATKGVYFDANGAVQEMSYTVGKSVPSNAVFTDTNTKVTQTNTTGDADYRLVLSANANDTTETSTARKSTNFKANPSTGVLSTPKVKISKSANALITGSGTAGSDKGSGVSPRYFPAKWTFNLGGNPSDGDIITIKIPVAGGTYSEWLSTDNGTTYHPIALNGKSRITSQYAVNTFLTLIYESSGVCTTYALAGADTVTDVTGTWRVINYYDSNTTYSSMSQSEATTGTSTTGRLITAKVLNDTISNKSNGHTILNGSGSAMNQRSKLQFVGADVVDDGTNDKTIITTTPQSMIGDAWVTSHAYAVGDYCIDENVLYKCKTAHTSTASNRPPYASYWDAVSVADILSKKEWKVLKSFEYTATKASDTFNLDVSGYSEVLIQGAIDRTSGGVGMTSTLYIPSQITVSSSSWCEYAWGWEGFSLYKNRISNHGSQWQYGWTKPDTANKIQVVILGKE